MSFAELTTISAASVPLEEFQCADVVTELAGTIRTRSCDLNMGRWVIAPADEWSEYPVLNFFVSLTADGREFKIYRFVTRADALQWVEDVCGHVDWLEMES